MQKRVISLSKTHLASKKTSENCFSPVLKELLTDKERQSKKCGRNNHGLNRMLFIVIGTFFVGLAYLSTMVPVLPQSPFLLVALASYSRSSKKLENWLLNNRLLGKHLKGIRRNSLGFDKILRNRRLLGIIIIKIFVLTIVLFHIFGLMGLLLTIMIIVGKLFLFAVAIYISGRIWSAPV